MDLFDVLSLIGGLCLFLFGMNIMGSSLERSAGGKLELLLSRLTTGRIAGLLTGLAVTTVIQSSSATTVMVVGFVNSGLMTLKQAINVIMGANIGTTVTSWLLSLAGIEGESVFIELLKPSSFSPVLALIGIIFFMFAKSGKKKDIGMILLGFATLMTGMQGMSSAVSGLKDVPAFGKLFLLFENPLLGVLAGALLTAVIQSSSASVGILQALSATGQISVGAAIPIIMGQNIGTCVTALISSVGANKNARRAALVHLNFNIIGSVFCVILFMITDALFSPALFSQSANHASIAVAHTAFNIFCTLLLLPASSLLEKIAYRMIPKTEAKPAIALLDERLLSTPAVALERSHALAGKMAETAVNAFLSAVECLSAYSPEKAMQIREGEDFTDKCENEIGNYLVKLSANRIPAEYSTDAALLLKIIGDLERIGDHAVNVLESAEEMNAKKQSFTPGAIQQLNGICSAVRKILSFTEDALVHENVESAMAVEPLEEIIDVLKEKCRSSHIERLQRGECTIEAGFIWSDILTNLERTGDHCSNIALAVLDSRTNTFHNHESYDGTRFDVDLYKANYEKFAKEFLAR